MSEPAKKLVPSAFTSLLTVAGLTWTRLIRGRALVVAIVIALLPIAYCAAAGPGVGPELFVFEVLIASVLAPMFVAASIGEEIEDRTTTYLWSRPVPRWTIIAGKLVALVPVVTAVVLGSWIVASQVAWKMMPDERTLAALAIGVAALSILSAGIASLAPRHGMALAIVYILFFDSPLGVLPATLRELSMTQQIRAISGLWKFEGELTTPLIAIALLAGAWGLIAAARIRRLEA